MGRRRPPARIHGVLGLDKPTGMTSRTALDRAARLVGERRCGHAGTLDPDASGVLALAFGDATRVARWLMAAPKGYDATIRFGHETSTDDAAGDPTRYAPAPALLTETAQSEVRAAVAAMPLGAVEQVPPAVSALKQDGVRDHVRARRGEVVERAPRLVRLDAVRWVGVVDAQTIAVSLRCGAGFYVRSWARDLGRALGSAAHLATLRRTSAAGMDVADCVTLEALEATPAEARAGRLVGTADALHGILPMVTVSPEVARALQDGKRPPVDVLSPASGEALPADDAQPLLVLEAGPGAGGASAGAPRKPVCVAERIEREGERVVRVLRGFPQVQPGPS